MHGNCPPHLIDTPSKAPPATLCPLSDPCLAQPIHRVVCVGAQSWPAVKINQNTPPMIHRQNTTPHPRLIYQAFLNNLVVLPAFPISPNIPAFPFPSAFPRSIKLASSPEPS